MCVCVCGIKGRAGKNAWNALTPEGAVYANNGTGSSKLFLKKHKGEGIENGKLNTRMRIGKRVENHSRRNDQGEISITPRRLSANAFEKQGRRSPSLAVGWGGAGGRGVLLVGWRG